MKVGIDSYCFHRFLGEVYPGQKTPAKPHTMDSVLDHAKQLGCDGISLESCFFPEFGKEYLTGWLTIYTKSDDRYLTKPPDESAFRRFAGQYSLPTEGFGPE